MTMKKIQELYQLFLASPKISTDTRSDVKGSLFFALSGERFNGNKFAREALSKGASFAIIDDEAYDENNGKYFVVDSALSTLQNLALFHRESSKAIVLGITGSNGKTTTKELIAKVLETEKDIIATQGNLNNHIGVPLTLLRITPKTQIAIVEMGANHQGEIAQLCQLARPNMGLITNIGKAHLEGMGGLEGVIKTKNELYQFIRTNNGTAIVNADDPLLMELSEGLHRITYGSSGADIVGQLLADKPGLKISATTAEENPISISSQLYGRYNFPNILAAITLGRYFKLKNKHIVRAIEGYVPENSRSQQMKTQHNKIIMDAYNANPVSMSLAINNFAEYKPSNPWLILGDMFELGDASAEEHRRITELVDRLKISRVIYVGQMFSQVAQTGDYQHFLTTDEAYEYLTTHPIRQAHILVKGSRGMRLEKLIPAL